MCGIAGFFGASSPHAASRVLAILQAQAHRGPDGAGLAAGSWTTYGRDVSALERPGDTPRPCVLGHNWLAIMDPSPGSRQPMVRGPLQLVFNGEIYNYIELREELIAQGESFSTDGDTEVLLALWRRMGPDCLSKLRGMFAFALLDQHGVLWLVRDPFGIKPLYWTRKDNGIYFASEIRGFHASGLLPRRLRDSAVICTSAIGINKFGADDTLFEEVHELSPGTLMRVKDHHHVEHYMRWPNLTSNLHGDEGIAALKAAFEESVTLHLRSRRRIASCLSGGLDSTNLVWAIQKQLGQFGSDFKAYTTNSDDGESSEFALAQMLCREAGVAHEVLNFDGAVPLADIVDMVIAYESPVHVIGPINQYLTLRHIAANGASVVIDGQGGDEMMSGYIWFVPLVLKAIEALGIDPAQFRSRINERAACSPATQELFESIFHNVPQWVTAFLGGNDFLGVSAADIEAMPETQWYLRSTGELAHFRDKSIRRAELQTLLRLEDRLGMWFGLECRVPFLDVEFNRVAAQLHPALLIHDGYLKYPYRMIQPDLPADVRFNTMKRGFWETHPDRYPWMPKLSRDLCLDSPALRRAFPKLEAGLDQVNFDQRWRLVQIALLERCTTREDGAALVASLSGPKALP